MPNLFTRAWRRAHDSLAFRSAHAYRIAFSFLPAFRRRPVHVDNQLSYITLVGAAQLPMLRASLWSLQQSSAELPRLIIACDATMNKPALSRMMKTWPGPIDIWSSEELQSFSSESLPQQFQTLCRKHVYGLKAVAIMRASLSGPILYADTDVLWFRAPQKLLPRSAAGNGVWLRLQQDRQMAYDSRLVDAWSFLLKEPYYCAGVILSRGDLREAFDQITFPALQGIYETPRQFTEQTTFAALQKKVDMPPLDAEEAYLSWDDQLTLAPTFFGKPWVLRHYVGPVRHLFWRDVFFLYLLRAWKKA